MISSLCNLCVLCVSAVHWFLKLLTAETQGEFAVGKGVSGETKHLSVRNRAHPRRIKLLPSYLRGCAQSCRGLVINLAAYPLPNCKIYALLVLSLLTAGAVVAAPINDLQRSFLNPPDDSRIMMRWWWFGPAV